MKRINHTQIGQLICLALTASAGLSFWQATAHAQGNAERPAAVQPVGLQQSATELRMLAALEQPASMQFVNTPLSEVVAWLSKQHQIPIRLDQRALEGDGIGPDTAVYMSVKGVRLRSALALLMNDFDLAYLVQEQSLLITTIEAAESALITYTYDVRDLTKSPTHSGQFEPDALIELIKVSVASSQWDEVGGPGSMAPHKGSLVISQTRDVHRQVQLLLTQLRRVAYDLEHDQSRAFSADWYLGEVGHLPSEQKIFAALDKPIPDLEFINVGLSEVLAYVQKKMKIPIVLDKYAINDLGISIHSPITKSIEGVTLRSGLNLLLDELDLTYVVRNEVLLITTTDKAENELTTAAFVVRDLFDQPTIDNAEADDLIDLIMTTIAVASWDQIGGPGSIVCFEQLDTLVITQTDEVLTEVEQMLSKLRKIRRAQRPWSAEKWAQQREQYLTTPRLVYFTMMTNKKYEPIGNPHEMVAFFRNSLAPEVHERAQITVSKTYLSLNLTPHEASRIEDSLWEASLSIYRSRDAVPAYCRGY